MPERLATTTVTRAGLTGNDSIWADGAEADICAAETAAAVGTKEADNVGALNGKAKVVMGGTPTLESAFTEPPAADEPSAAADTADPRI